MRTFLVLILSALACSAQLPFKGVSWYNGPMAASGGLVLTNIYADFLTDFNAAGTNQGAAVTLTIATNATRSFVKGPWLYQAGNAPQSNTNIVVWTNRAVLPNPFFCDGSVYDLTQTTNSWMLTNANYQFLSMWVPPGPKLSWFVLVKVTESGNNVGYNVVGTEPGGLLDWGSWSDDPATGFWKIETASVADTTISAVGYTNKYLYFTQMYNTNNGQTLMALYTNSAADMSGTWSLVGTSTNHLALTAGTGGSIMDIGRMDVHGNVAASKFEFIMAGYDSTFAHFPMGPLPWTNAWAPILTSINASPAATTCAITWNTDHSADSTVNYGLTSAYGSSTADSTKVRSHTINLSSLTASTTYHYQVVSVNGAGLSSASADQTFSTTSAGNNVALVGSQTFHAGSVNAASATASTPGNVTSGNSVIVGVATWSDTGAMTAGMLTKTAGTATIGTIVLDKTSGHLGGGQGSTAIYRVPITGSGSLTLKFTPAVTSYIVLGGGEFTGLNASPVGTPGVNNATGAAHTTGSITTAANGMIFYVGTEEPNNNFTRTFSDTLIFKVDTGGSTSTGIIQYKIIGSSPNTLTDTTGSDSEIWQVIWVPYKTS